MGNIKKNETGFSAVELLIILIVVAVIGGVGYFVYKSHHKTTPASVTTTTPTVDPYAGWQSYSDSHLSFKYPSGWQTAAGADKHAAVSVTATSPAFTTTSMTTGGNPNAPVTLALQLSSSSSTVYCSDDPCKVTAVTPLSNAQLPNSVLAIVNQTSNNGTNYSQYVVVSDSTKVGDTTVKALKAGSSSIYVFGQPQYAPKDGGFADAARVTDTAALQVDGHFKDLVNLINSTKFN